MASARRLRRQLSLPEMLLWRLLRLNRRELRFRKQHPIGPFVADFYCPAAKMVIEIDGAVHDRRQDADSGRDAYMRALGLTVMRIPAAEVLADPEGVAETACIAYARALLAPPPLSRAAERSPSPSLRDGAVLKGPLSTHCRQQPHAG